MMIDKKTNKDGEKSTESSEVFKEILNTSLSAHKREIRNDYINILKELRVGFKTVIGNSYLMDARIKSESESINKKIKIVCWVVWGATVIIASLILMVVMAILLMINKP